MGIILKNEKTKKAFTKNKKKETMREVIGKPKETIENNRAGAKRALEGVQGGTPRCPPQAAIFFWKD